MFLLNLTNALTVLIYEICFETFYEKKKKKNYFFTTFYIFQESSIKIFHNSTLVIYLIMFI